MSYRKLLISLALASVGLFVPPALLGSNLPQQTRGASRSKAIFDPLKQITAGFPKSITLNKAGTVLEFCPDNTCDGFVAPAGTPAVTLKDFAYLYIYFFSGYIYLPEWRNRPEARTTADQVLSKPEYRNCKNDSSLEAARCVLLGLGRKGSVRLISVGYDEGKRNVMRLDVVKELEKH